MIEPTYSAILEHQIAIIARLTADSALMARVSGIFDVGGVPEFQAYPFVALGEHVETPWPVFRKVGRNLLLLFHIWSQQPSFDEALLILGDLIRLLDHKPLGTLTHFGNSKLEYEMSAQQNDPDDSTIRHMPVHFRALSVAL
jgi:Protein of unknown function (DUF3168)